MLSLKLTIKLCLFILFYIFTISCSSAENVESIKMPSHNQERLLINNLDLSVGQFKAAYYGNDLTQRRFAEMYLIGVLDLSEGTEWCAYNTLLPHTISELLYSGFNEYDWSFTKNGRASVAITSIISKFSPCKDIK